MTYINAGQFAKCLTFSLVLFLSLGIFSDVSGAILGDCNTDNRVDVLDFQLLSNAFGKTQGQSGYNPACDFNTDTRIDILDFQVLSNNFGRTNSAITPTSVVTQGPLPTIPPPPLSGSGVWISHTDLMSRPTTGTAWNSILSAASSSWGTANVSDQDSNHDQMVLAGAFACARAGQYCDKTILGLKAAIGTETKDADHRWLAVGRNVLSYTIAADVMRNSGRLNGTDLNAVSNWLTQFLTRTLPSNNGGGLEVLTPFESGSNASAQEGAVYAAIARYTGNTTKLNYVWNRFRLYSCDKTNNPETAINISNGFEGGWSHSATLSGACAVNPVGTFRNDHRIDGAVINDIVRGASFRWPPVYTDYVWTGLQGYVSAAIVLNKAGYSAFSVKDQAVLRAVDYICHLKDATGYDWWKPSHAPAIKQLAKWAYGYSPSGCGISYPVGGGMIIGFTDWTHPR